MSPPTLRAAARSVRVAVNVARVVTALEDDLHVEAAVATFGPGADVTPLTEDVVTVRARVQEGSVQRAAALTGTGVLSKRTPPRDLAAEIAVVIDVTSSGHVVSVT